MSPAQQLQLPGFEAAGPQGPPASPAPPAPRGATGVSAASGPPAAAAAKPIRPRTAGTPRQGRARYTLFLAVFPGYDDALHCAGAAQALRRQHRLRGPVLATGRLHITLQVVAKNAATVAPAVVHTVRCAAEGIVCRGWPAVPITFDHALSFLPSQALVLRCDAHSDAALAQLRQALGLALRATGLRAAPSSMPHMTMLYDRRTINRQAIQPVCWTATRLVLVLSHVGRGHHEWIAEWPLDGSG